MLSTESVKPLEARTGLQYVRIEIPPFKGEIVPKNRRSVLLDIGRILTRGAEISSR